MHAKLTVIRAASVVVATLLFASSIPTVASAANGDCGQPVSNGAAPVATDCLFILQSAVGAQTCDPTCICDLNGSGGNPNATDALACLNASVGVPGLLGCACPPPSETDDFDDNQKDATKWTDDIIAGNGTLQEVSQHLEYRCSAGTDYDEAYRPWVKSELPYDTDWEIQLDVTNLMSLSGDTHVNSAGFQLEGPDYFQNYLYAELYGSSLGGPPQTNGFYAELGFGGDFSFVDTGDLGTTRGAVRMTFDAATKVVTLFYDADVTDGYQWTPFGSFGVAGSGGDDGNGNWGLSEGAKMGVGVYGFSQNLQVAPGQIYGDNFSISGGVAPSSGELRD